VDRDIVELNRKRYQAAKDSVKLTLYRERKKFSEKLDGEDKKRNVFRVAWQIV